MMRASLTTIVTTSSRIVTTYWRLFCGGRLISHWCAMDTDLREAAKATSIELFLAEYA